MILDVKLDYTKCKNEQQFKKLYIKEWSKGAYKYFCIETEETIKGFPDVLCINKITQNASFIEFKFTQTGKIKFQPTQPAFYRSNMDLNISVAAYNYMTDKVHIFKVKELFKDGSPYQINDKAEVDLRRAE